MEEQKPSLGRVVLYAFVDPHNGELVERPARIVRIWDDKSVNMVIDLDGGNDHALIPDAERTNKTWQPVLQVWRTSVERAADMSKPEPHRWRWPPRV